MDVKNSDIKKIYYVLAEHVDFEAGAQFISDSLEDLLNRLNRFIDQSNEDLDEQRYEHFDSIRVGDHIEIFDTNEDLVICCSDAIELWFEDGSRKIVII